MDLIDLDIVKFYSEKIELLYKNKYFREFFKEKNKQIYPMCIKNTDKSFKSDFIAELEQGEVTIFMLKKLGINKNQSILEIGGGIGLVYGFLKNLGYNIYSIEPSEGGFINSYKLGNILFKVLKIDNKNWYPLKAEEADKLKVQFDIIVSNNVLEHVFDLKLTFLTFKKILKRDGAMIHNTVNYYVPYEPHFRMLLFPFFPKLTAIFRPKLKISELWRNLHFVTTTEIKSLCKDNNLSVSFYNDWLVNNLKRLEVGNEFSKRHKHYLQVYRLLKYTHALMFLNKLPVSLTTPIQFIVKKIN